MNVNLTLIGQAISFAIFVWFCMRFVWPPVIGALEARRQRIADGLADAEASAALREQVQEEAEQARGEARDRAAQILAQADRRAAEIVAEAREAARAESERIQAQGRAEVEQSLRQARERLRGEVAGLAVAGAEAVLGREVDAAAHAAALDDLAGRL